MARAARNEAPRGARLKAREVRQPRAAKPRAARNEVSTASAGSAVYHGGSDAPRVSTWKPISSKPNAHLGSLSRLRDRSADAYRNNGYATSIIEKLVTNLIGTGIVPLSKAPDREWRKLLMARWLRFVDQADADGQLDFFGLQQQATRGWLIKGDNYTRLRMRLASDGLAVPLQVQNLSAEFCPHTHNGIAENGNAIRAGIEFDKIGRRLAYYFHPSRPEVDDYDAGILRRVEAETVVHLYNPLEAGQLRGLPILTQALVKLHKIDSYDDATLYRQEIGNLFALFITKEQAAAESLDIDPVSGLARKTDGDRQVVTLEPGTSQELAPGEDVKFSEPPDPPATYADFLRTQLRGACASAGVPYEVVTGDMSGMNDRTIRVVLNEFKRRLQMWQHQIIAFKWCRPIWAAFVDRAVLSGAVPAPPNYFAAPETWRDVRWMPARFAYIHPVQDVDADKAAIRAGFTSRAAVVAEYGEDAEEIDQQQAEDNARADELELVYDSDPRHTSSAGQAQ